MLDAAAKAAGWGKPLPAGVFRGIAVTERYGSYTAAVVEVSVSDEGELDDPPPRARRSTAATW